MEEKKCYLLPFDLQEGYIHNWLFLGPFTRIPAPDILAQAPKTWIKAFDEPTPGFEPAPVERDPAPAHLNPAKYQDWEVVHCQEDHLVDCTRSFSQPGCHQAWAFALIDSAIEQDCTLILSSASPISLWLNGEHLLRLDLATGSSRLDVFPISIHLRQGQNPIWVRLDQAGSGDLVMAFAARLEGLRPFKKVRVLLPSVTSQIDLRQNLQRAFESLYMDRTVYIEEDIVTLKNPARIEGGQRHLLRLQKPTGEIYGETECEITPGGETKALYALQLPHSPMQATLMPLHIAYYDHLILAEKRIPIRVINEKYFPTSTGEYDDRLVGLLTDIERREEDFSTQIIRMSFGWWEKVDLDAIRTAAEKAATSKPGALSDLFLLLWMRTRMIEYQDFPQEILPELDAKLQSVNYASLPIHGERFGEFLQCAAQVLAGQLYPKVKMGKPARAGSTLRRIAEEQGCAWIQQQGSQWITDWGTGTDLLALALASLVELAKNDNLRELSAVLLDKMFFNLALHSFQGVYGGAQVQAMAEEFCSARLGLGSSLNRLVWGAGAFNRYNAVLTVLGLSGEYSVPEIISLVAQDSPAEVWARERWLEDGMSIARSTYRTPEVLLSSLANTPAGSNGYAWRAMLSPEAVVFTNHPACSSQSESRKPGYWRGTASQAQIGQWKNALIALYNLPSQDWMGFTHAYFPTFAFDQYFVDKSWAVALKGEAFVALYATNGMHLLKRGEHAYHELRQEGTQQAWFCLVGKREPGEKLSALRERIRKIAIKNDGGQIAVTLPDGTRLTYAWNAPLTVNGSPLDPAAIGHIESPYCLTGFPAPSIDVQYGTEGIRLKFD
ncbi:MAG TPA: hypothetical protein VIO61_16485 [Anaerolineaceae bacterium]